MQFEGAFLKEQGIEFGILVVKKYILDNSIESEKLIKEASQKIFNGYPVILMAQDSKGVISYRGRPDIVKFLSTTQKTYKLMKYTIS